ncbi:hypothetical protein ACVU7I_02400 [Patulibacter sp. S7RM1-6]
MPADDFLSFSTIRLDGSFNPAIVQHDWLLAKGLIDDADRAELVEGDDTFVYAPLFAGNRLSWIIAEVTTESVMLTSTPETETVSRIREFAIGLLRHLPETPIRQVSIESDTYMTVPNADRLLSRFAPISAWPDSLSEWSTSKIARSHRQDHSVSTVRVEASLRDDYDIYVSLETAFSLPPDDATAHAASSTIADHWTAIHTTTAEIADFLAGDVA